MHVTSSQQRTDGDVSLIRNTYRDRESYTACEWFINHHLKKKDPESWLARTHATATWDDINESQEALTGEFVVVNDTTHALATLFIMNRNLTT